MAAKPLKDFLVSTRVTADGKQAASVARCVMVGCLLVALPAPVLAADAAPPPPPEVTVAKPVYERITEWDEYTGRFVAKQRVDVRARVSGYLQSVHFEEGHTVTAEQLLFIIDQRPFQAEVARAQAGLDCVTTQLKVAELEFARGQRLESSRAMSKESAEERRAARDAALAESPPRVRICVAPNLTWALPKCVHQWPAAYRISEWTWAT